jgi:hypothetical protein
MDFGECLTRTIVAKVREELAQKVFCGDRFEFVALEEMSQER